MKILRRILIFVLVLAPFSGVWAQSASGVGAEYRSLEEMYVPKRFKMPVVALKLNMLYGLGLLTPNLALEVGVGKKTTLELAASYHPWGMQGSETRADNKKLVHYIIKPEVRFWLRERFNGHFFGVSPIFTEYNISDYKVPILNFQKAYRYNGMGYGAGVSYGYSIMAAKWLGVEFVLGVGALWVDYKRYSNQYNGAHIADGDGFYIGPTSGGINLVFLLK